MSNSIIDHQLQFPDQTDIPGLKSYQWMPPFNPYLFLPPVPPMKYPRIFRDDKYGIEIKPKRNFFRMLKP